MTYFKDNSDINCHSHVAEEMKDLANIVCKNKYEDFLLPLPRKPYEHKKVHESCSLDSKNAEKVTEKRICRCWNYYNKKCHVDKCDICGFPFKRENIGDIKILDYEVPTIFNMEKLGGIDWILSDGIEEFATEVKPPESQETIVRMIAEILTYKIGTTYVPAICFFKTNRNGGFSKQCQDYLKFKDDENFCLIKRKTGLRIFYITFDDKYFKIHDAQKEPIE